MFSIRIRRCQLISVCFIAVFGVESVHPCLRTRKNKNLFNGPLTPWPGPAGPEGQGTNTGANSIEPLDPTGVKALEEALGGTTKVRAYPGRQTGQHILDSTQLNCDFQSICRWHNDQIQGDIQWVLVEGEPNALRWKLGTGTNAKPGTSFLIAASQPTSSTDRALLVSEAIPCQMSGGKLVLNHWLSKARRDQEKVELALCIRNAGDLELMSCQQVATSNPGPTAFVIDGPRSGPFELVLSAENFVNEPEGAFVAIDNIRYEADVLPDRDRCEDSGLLNERELPPSPLDSNYEDHTVAPTIATKITTTTTTTTTPTTTTTESPRMKDQRACRLLSCNFEEDACEWNPNGATSAGLGFDGWLVRNGFTNRANPLTGIRTGPDLTRGSWFAAATFEPGVLEQPTDRFVLESPLVRFREAYEMVLHTYVAADGLKLYICDNPEGVNCWWQNPPMQTENVLNNRHWKETRVPLPVGEYRIFIIAGYGPPQNYNIGQVGVTNIRMLDSNGDQLCFV